MTEQQMGQMSECKHLLAAWIGTGPAAFGGSPGRYAQADSDDLYYCKCCGAVQFGLGGEWSVPGSKGSSRDDEIETVKRAVEGHSADICDIQNRLSQLGIVLRDV